MQFKNIFLDLIIIIENIFDKVYNIIIQKSRLVGKLLKIKIIRILELKYTHKILELFKKKKNVRDWKWLIKKIIYTLDHFNIQQ